MRRREWTRTERIRHYAILAVVACGLGLSVVHHFDPISEPLYGALAALFATIAVVAAVRAIQARRSPDDAPGAEAPGPVGDPATRSRRLALWSVVATAGPIAIVGSVIELLGHEPRGAAALLGLWAGVLAVLIGTHMLYQTLREQSSRRSRGT